MTEIVIVTEGGDDQGPAKKIIETLDGLVSTPRWSVGRGGAMDVGDDDESEQYTPIVRVSDDE